LSIQELTSELEAPYQILDENGRLVGNPPDISADRLLEMYRWMYFIRAFSNKIIALQRQGKATTWGSLTGHEATSVGVAAPLQPQDWIAGSYRDAGSYFVKGLPPSAIAYYQRGLSPAYPAGVNCLPVQIVIGTQVLHAVGIAMAAKIKGDPVVSVGLCGDGATSEGDFNEALNFAGVYQAPIVFGVVNNGWAISLPRHRQSAAKTLAARGPGFGIPSRVIDGNDLFAVYSASQEAIDRARNGGGPTLLEFITYRLGAHTTADDPTRYRVQEELAEWEAKEPIKRMRLYLMGQNMLTEAEDTQIAEEAEARAQEVVDEAFNTPAHDPERIFDFTWENRSPRMEQQREEMRRNLQEDF
jgi:pyruvate dehydrogenase E1 component alpha subunit